MVVLHCTRKLLTRLGARSAVAGRIAESTTLLGDWYATVFVVARRLLVLCVAERSLFAVLLPLKEARTLVPRWQAAVERRLLTLDVLGAQVAAEAAAMCDVVIAPASYGRAGRVRGPATAGPSGSSTGTANAGRRLLGVLTDMVWQCEGRTMRAADTDVPDLDGMASALDQLLCKPLAYARPADVTRALFTAAAAHAPSTATGLHQIG